MEHIINTLNNIGSEYKPIPFWSWNDDLQPEELKRQIRWMHDHGIGGFFMHAREGLKTKYLSDDWMHAIEVCSEEAKKLGMNPWAYDENGFPSGFVGGKLLEKTENRDYFLTYSIGRFDPSADLIYSLANDQLQWLSEKKLPAGMEEAQFLHIYIGRSVSTVDILNPAVVDQFIAETHEKYKAHFKENLSDAVCGFFTDEPEYYRPQTPYTPLVRDYFRTTYGQEIFAQLGLLFVEKEGYRTFRYRYWLAMQRLMLDNFAKKVYTWCDDNGIKLTGHYVDEITMGFQIMCCAGVMPFYEFEHIPGIDWLGRDTDNELAPRQLSSAAHQLGKKKILTETFGCCGWDVTPGDLRRLAGFQYANGVNLMCHHLLPYSEKGQRKRDYPAHFNPINPWINPHFKDFNDFFSRLGYLLSEGEEKVNVALFHPIRSCYFDYKRETEPDFEVQELDAKLQWAMRTLSSRGIDYHFLDETLLEEHGFVEGSKIGCGKCSYDYLVFPKTLTMGVHTKELIQKFVQNGGKVLLLEDKPGYWEGEPFDYSWLESNCSLQEINDAQPYWVENPDTQLYYAYRAVDGKEFIYIQNGSADETYTQTFRFRSGACSFTALDPVNFETKQLPLTVTLQGNDALLLFASQEEVEPEAPLPTAEIKFENAEVDFETNFLTLDILRYSKDGVHFSEPMLRNRLFSQLLEERYKGKLWLQYIFEVQEIPEKLTLLAEKEGMLTTKVNGNDICFNRQLDLEPCVWLADISQCIHTGENTFETTLDWFQSDMTYHILFEDTDKVSLMTMLLFDSEIESVYLAGHFGVYSHGDFVQVDDGALSGHSFYIGKAPELVSEPTTDGLAFFRGKLRMQQEITLEDPKCRLHILGRYVTAKVWLNGGFVGEMLFDRMIDVSGYAKKGANLLEVEFTVGNRNLLGPFHNAVDDIYVCPEHFDAFTLPDSADGAPCYKLDRFYKESIIQQEE